LYPFDGRLGKPLIAKWIDETGREGEREGEGIAVEARSTSMCLTLHIISASYSNLLPRNIVAYSSSKFSLACISIYLLYVPPNFNIECVFK
jgi:hypothetical protein